MRKDTRGGKNIAGLYTTYEIRGLNLDRFINYLKKQGVELYDIKKLSRKRLIVTVNFKQSQNFFAIADKMCYNVKKVGHGGWGYPFFALYSSFGLFIGALFFLALTVVANDYIFAINFSGSGSIYKNEVREFLSEQGVIKYSRFSDIDLSNLEDAVLAENPHLSFVSMKKSGNRLEVELVLSSEKVKTLDGNVYALYSDVSGTVESIKVYRGTAVVAVGDRVEKGDLLVNGEVEIKEQTLKINVLCAITVVAEYNYEYFSLSEAEEENAVFFAESQLEDREIISSEVVKIQKDNGYLYTVNVKYRRILYAG